MALSDSRTIEVTLKQLAYQVLCETTFTYRVERTCNQADLIDILGTWDDEVLPAINAIQHDSVVNVGLRIQQRGVNYVEYQTGLSGIGSSPAVTAQKLPSEYSYYFRLGVGQSYSVNTWEALNSRAIKRGALFICGADDTFWDDGRFVIPATATTIIADAISALTTTFQVAASYDLHPMVAGAALPALTDPVVAARDSCMADVVSAQLKNIAHLRSRLS